jgi:hypothetical protein
MTFICPHCGRIIDGHILTDTQMIDHDMALETANQQRDTLQGMVTNIRGDVESTIDLVASMTREMGQVEALLKRASGELDGR